MSSGPTSVSVIAALTTVQVSATAIPVVPTLSATTFITKIPDAIAYIIRHFVSSPKGLQETLYAYTISFMDIISKNSQDVDAICVQTTQQLLNTFNNIYGQNSTSVTVTPVTSDSTNYDFMIDISVDYNGNSYTISNEITVDDNGRLQINTRGR